MSYSTLHTTIRTLLEESSQTFSLLVDAGGHPNMDYAGFAGQQALGQFRYLLNDPHLTAERLAALLRRADRKRRARACTSSGPREHWAAFMAGYLASHINANSEAGT